MRSLKQTAVVIIAGFAALAVISSCRTTFSKNPLPAKEWKTEKKLPAFWEGDFRILGAEEEGALGGQYFKIEFRNRSACTGQVYLSFTEEDLRNHPDSRYYSIAGDTLKYQNDSLKTRYEMLQAQAAGGNLSGQDSMELESLNIARENGEILNSFRLERAGERYVYEKETVFEIDLKRNLYTSFEEEEKKEQKMELRKKKGLYYLNIFGEKETASGWQTIFIAEKPGGMIAKTIDTQYVRDHIETVGQITPFEELSNQDLLMDPAEQELEALLADEQFLEVLLDLERVGRAPAKGFRWWWVGAGMVVLAGIGLFRKTRMTANQ